MLLAFAPGGVRIGLHRASVGPRRQGSQRTGLQPDGVSAGAAADDAGMGGFPGSAQDGRGDRRKSARLASCRHVGVPTVKGERYCLLTLYSLTFRTQRRTFTVDKRIWGYTDATFRLASAPGCDAGACVPIDSRQRRRHVGQPDTSTGSFATIMGQIVS